MEKTLENKKIAMVISFRDFRDEEYFIPKDILAQAGVEISTVSTEKGIAIGTDGGEVKVDILLDDLRVSDFDAVVFIGGQGVIRCLDNNKSYEIISQTLENGKILAAICISPIILANAGVLDGKKATVWSNPMDKSAVKILEEQGAIYQDELVVIDGKIITGNGPEAAEKFAQALTEILK